MNTENQKRTRVAKTDQARAYRRYEKIKIKNTVNKAEEKKKRRKLMGCYI